MDKKINELLERLNSDEKLKDICIIKAYPYTKKATILSRVVATLSPDEAEIESVSVENDVHYGKYAINIDVFVPFNKSSKLAVPTLEKLINASMDMTTTGVKIGTITANENTSCFHIKGTLTFSGSFSKEDFDGE